MISESAKEIIKKSVKELGWERLTPIQKRAFPVVLRKKDSLLISPTGTGKTEAAIIPIFSHLVGKKGKGVRLLYVTPLRALNRDIFRRLIGFAEKLGLRAEIRHGDTPESIRRKITKNPPDILITTPETLSIIITSQNIRKTLSNLEWVVVDELHELLGSERGSHLSLSLELLDDISKEKVVRIGLSATVGDFNEAAKFLFGKRREFAVLVDTSVREYDISCKFIDGSLEDLVIEVLRLVSYEEKLGVRSVLIFTNTRIEAEELGSLLRANAPDKVIEVHHGSLSREIREEAEKKLKFGEASLVVCTSSLELGIDIGYVDLVIQVGSPRQAIKLVQRVGRSRHKIGEKAKGLIVTNKSDQEAESLSILRRIKRNDLERPEIHFKPLDVLAHHLAGLSIALPSYTIDYALKVFTKAYPFWELTREELNEVLEFLGNQGIVRYDGELVRRRGANTYKYYFENLSTIPDIEQFDVIDVSSNKPIGRLDQMFVGEYGEVGNSFILKGLPWRIVGVNDEKRVVHVEPLPKGVETIPYWIGELIPVEFETAQIAGRLRHNIISERIKVSKRLKEILEDTKKVLGIIPDDNSIVIEEAGERSLVIHACFGTKVNQALATLLSTLLSSKLGFNVETRSDPYRILLTSAAHIKLKDVKDVLRANVDVRAILEVASQGTHIMNWKTWHVARKFGVVERNASYDRRMARLIQDRMRNTPLYKEVLRELMHEKYDIERCEEILQKIREGRIKLLSFKLKDYTPLAKPILELGSWQLAMPLSMDKAIISLVRERLDKARHRLVCLICGSWETVVRTKDAKENYSCPKCHSRIIGRTYVDDNELAKIARKRAKGIKLSKQEDKEFRRAWKSANIIMQNGKRALIALSGYGVGVDTAARVLRDSLTLDDLYKNVYLAEKNYIATRSFWED
jgi:ATP-dependent Lhr-like helicase